MKKGKVLEPSSGLTAPYIKGSGKTTKRTDKGVLYMRGEIPTRETGWMVNHMVTVFILMELAQLTVDTGNTINSKDRVLKYGPMEILMKEIIMKG